MKISKIESPLTELQDGLSLVRNNAVDIKIMKSHFSKAGNSPENNNNNIRNLKKVAAWEKLIRINNLVLRDVPYVKDETLSDWILKIGAAYEIDITVNDFTSYWIKTKTPAGASTCYFDQIHQQNYEGTLLFKIFGEHKCEQLP